MKLLTPGGAACEYCGDCIWVGVEDVVGSGYLGELVQNRLAQRLVGIVGYHPDSLYHPRASAHAAEFVVVVVVAGVVEVDEHCRGPMLKDAEGDVVDDMVF